MYLITNQKELDQALANIAQQSAIYVDTEFYRRQTFFAKLSLIQISTDLDDYVIDVLCNLDLKKFRDILIDKSICKVMHSSDQDLQIFYYFFKVIPQNLFDTQIAASVLGLGSGVGYGNLCQRILNIQLNKSQQATNWLKRPLTHEQISYAVNDTKYLGPLYDRLKAELIAGEHMKEFNKKMLHALQLENIIITPERMLKRLRLGRVNQFQTIILHELFAFREEIAKELNVPRGFILKDSEVIKMSERLPQDKKQLDNFKLTSKYLNNDSFRNKLIDLCVGLKKKSIF